MFDIRIEGDVEVVFTTYEPLSTDPAKTMELVLNQHAIPGVSDGGAPWHGVSPLQARCGEDQLAQALRIA